MFFIILASAINVFAFHTEQSMSETQFCINHIESYQLYYASNIPNRQARALHLHNLLQQTKNKFKVLNDLYLHYRSINDSSDPLSSYLEACLINYLRISLGEVKFTRARDRRNIV